MVCRTCNLCPEKLLIISRNCSSDPTRPANRRRNQVRSSDGWSSDLVQLGDPLIRGPAGVLFPTPTRGVSLEVAHLSEPRSGSVRLTHPIPWADAQGHLIPSLRDPNCATSKLTPRVGNSFPAARNSDHTHPTIESWDAATSWRTMRRAVGDQPSLCDGRNLQTLRRGDGGL